MAKYKIKNTNILHDGKIRKEGSVVELSDEQAKKLEGFVELVKEKTPTKTNEKTNDKTTKTKTETKKTEVITEGEDNNGGESDGK